jgi:dihydrofolate reductase
MATVIADMSMSLDGFIAHPDDTVDGLFDWYGNGPIEIPSADPRLTFHVSDASAPVLKEAFERGGALVTGRHLFDVTNGWGGNHPVGCPVFVVSHSIPDGWPRPDAPFTFVSDVAEAISMAKEVAGDKWVSVASTTMTRQALDLGLVDEIHVNLVPILLGEGIRWFDGLANHPVRLAGPDRVVEGDRVTHLRYQVLRD